MSDHSLLRRRRIVVACLALALLAACAREPSRTSDSPPASDSTGPAGAAPSGTVTEIVALGNEPFWNVTVSADSIVWRTPEQIDGVRFPAVAVQQVEGRRVWRTSRSGSPSRLELAIVPRECSDGMSDRTYSFAAEVVLDSMSFTGCAEERPARR